MYKNHIFSGCRTDEKNQITNYCEKTCQKSKKNGVRSESSDSFDNVTHGGHVYQKFVSSAVSVDPTDMLLTPWQSL